MKKYLRILTSSLILLILCGNISYVSAQNSSVVVPKVSNVCRHGNNKKTCKKCNTSTNTKTNTNRQKQNNNYSNNVVVTNVLLRNVDNDLNVLTSSGSKMYSSDMRYLQPILIYTPLKNEVTKTVYIKYILPDGNLLTGDNSPSGYSRKETVTFNSSGRVELQGYGSSNSSLFPSGSTFVEIWIDGKKACSGIANIYDSGINITGVQVRNLRKNGDIIDDYGATLYSSKMRYLSIKLNYTPVYPSVTKKVYLKIYDSNGVLKSGGESPSGYTISRDCVFDSSGESWLCSWGNDSNSIYPAGTTRYEIWIDGKKVYSGSVYIYGSTGINVTDVLYCNTNKNGSKIDDWGANLYSYKMRYLAIELHYTPLNKSVKKTVYSKIYLPDGTLLTGNNSPSGYSTSCSATFDSSGSTVLNGYGHESLSKFPSGTTRYEVWIDNEKIYSGSVYIR